MKMLEEIDLQPADDRKTLEWITVLAAAGLDYPHVMPSAILGASFQGVGEPA